MKKIINIAIDGPSGAGKSTIAKMLAARTGMTYLDTGAPYRAVGLKAYRDGWPEDDAKVRELLKDVRIEFRHDEKTGSQHVYLDGEDVSDEIRRDHISGYGSRFSALPSVRAALLEMQRRIARERSVVMDGRDIGTCVLPNADLKIFLTASVDIRAARRYNELKAKGEEVSPEEVRTDIKARDERDMTRAVSPLRKADDAIEIDSGDMTPDEVVKKITALLGEKCQD